MPSKVFFVLYTKEKTKYIGYINIKKENYKSIILKNVPIAYGMRKRDISF